MIVVGDHCCLGMSTTPSLAALEERLKPHRAVERYFAQSGRTLRKGRFRLWFNETIKPHLLRTAFRVAGLYNRGRRNALAVELRSVDFSFPDLPPALDGFCMLQISDLHIDKLDGLAENVVAIVENLRPDLCVFTGDYRYEIRGDSSEVYPRMAAIIAAIQSKHGIYGILGNHDSADIAIRLEQLGVRMLVNDAEAIETRGQRFWLLGVDDPFDYRCDNLPQALACVPAGEFKVLLAHTPSLYAQAEAANVRLYLCGHTHAGQIRLPVIGAVKKNGNYPRQFVQDRWSYKHMQAYTSWGAGCSTLPIRFRCPPEVTLISLRRA